MTTVGMLHIRNEARWIARVVQAIKPICSSIFILDDHSTDRTAAICKEEGCIVIPSPFEGLNESRDMQFLYEQTMKAKPDWIVSIDGDEELEPGGAEKVKNAIATAPKDVSYFSLKIIYLWDRVDLVRVDGVYGRFRRKRVFKPEPGAKFVGNGTAHNLHCGGSGNIKFLSGRVEPLDVGLLHYGYLHKADRLKKWQWHNQIEPDNVAEDGFRHIVQGDIPEVPATARLKHAGPLTLRPR